MPSRYCSKNAALSLSGQKNGLRAISSQSHLRAIDLVRAHLHQRAAHLHLGQDFARDGAGRDARGGLARRGTSAAAIIAQAVFGLIGEVGMARAKLVLDLGIVLGALIGVLDQQRDRRSRRHLHAGLGMRHHAGQDFDRVRLLALGGEARLSRTAAIQIVLDVLIGQRDQRRAAIDHAADRDPVAFAEGRDPEQVAEGVVGHGVVVSATCRAAVKPATVIPGDAKHRTRNLEIPGLVLRTVPE